MTSGYESTKIYVVRGTLWAFTYVMTNVIHFMSRGYINFNIPFDVVLEILAHAKLFPQFSRC